MDVPMRLATSTRERGLAGATPGGETVEAAVMAVASDFRDGETPRIVARRRYRRSPPLRAGRSHDACQLTFPA
ncbi:hypothetical protein MAFF212519_09770 [Clavibacter michiganensis]